MATKTNRPRLTLYIISAREGGFAIVDANGKRRAHVRGRNPSMEACQRIASEATGSIVTLVGSILTAWQEGPYVGTSITLDEHDSTIERLQAAELASPVAVAA